MPASRVDAVNRSQCTAIVLASGLFLAMFAVLLGQHPLLAAEPGQTTLEGTIRGVPVEGTPLAWSHDRVFFLGRDGRLWDFHPDEASRFKKTRSPFESYPASIMRARLQQELGPQFEVTGTGHFLVAHPLGQRQQWAERFEEMYRSFVMYFQVRGFTLRNPEFSMVAVVFPSRNQFARYALAEGVEPGPAMLGYYSTASNRVVMFDVGDGQATAADWRQNASTLVHEAAHQSAFNTGIHNRFAQPPRWVAEGLGTLFEARGVWNPRGYPSRADRINRQRLSQFRDYAADRRQPGAVVELLSSDRLFETDPQAAYGQAWALTFFLVEQYPREFARYLAKTGQRPAFSAYPAVQRLKDFTEVFGDNFRMLESRLLRFIEELD